MTQPSAEVARQEALLYAIDAPELAGHAGLAGPAERGVAGLQIYRANADAVAERTLRTSFPTLCALLGDADFKHLAREFRRADPPGRGDLGEWGDGLAAWVRVHPGLAGWPYLGDCAELDWLRHACERAADPSFDAASLALLEAHAPDRFRLAFAPGTALLESCWPVASLYAAHQAESTTRLAQVRDLIAAAQGETVLVVRDGWRAAVHPIDAPTCAWTRDLLAGVSLGAALERAGPQFDFTAWLTRALAQRWLHAVLATAG
jgi:Putative DNA-binding domain